MLPLFIFGFTLAVLPLVSTRVAAILFILAYLSVLFLKIKPANRALIFSLIATGALGVASVINLNPPTALFLLQWLILIWSVPLFSALINKYGRQKVATVVLTIIALHAIWGISQFILQRDLGLTRLGESKINIYEPAVAKVEVNFPPFKLLRSYGPYKHANSFAGVLVLGLTLVFSPLRRGRSRGGLDNKSEVLTFFLLTLALATTFSRAAIFSFLLVIIFNAKIFFKLKYFLLFAVIVLTFFPLMFYRFSFTGQKDKAVPERINSVQWASVIIKENNFWQGVGIGHYPAALKNHLDSQSVGYQPWQIDFVHSIPLLLLAEWGMASIILMTAFSFWLIAYSSKPPHLLTTHYLPAGQAGSLLTLLTLLPILLTDHYFATQLSPAVLLLVIFSLLIIEKSDDHRFASAVPQTTTPPKPAKPPQN